MKRIHKIRKCCLLLLILMLTLTSCSTVMPAPAPTATPEPTPTATPKPTPQLSSDTSLSQFTITLSNGKSFDILSENGGDGFTITGSTSLTYATIVIIANDKNATISGDIGKLDLVKGKNSFKIVIMAENGNKRTIRFTINAGYSYEQMAANCIEVLQRLLKNPSSLDVLCIKYTALDNMEYSFVVEYTAMNGFGGASREYSYFTVNQDTGEASFVIKIEGSVHDLSWPELDVKDVMDLVD